MRTCVAMLGAALLWGCGGGSEETETETEVETETETEGGEGGGDVPWEEEGQGGSEGGTSAAPSTGPGRITVQILVGGEEATGEIEVRGESGEPTRGQPGVPMTLQPGSYILTARITDADVLVDRPTLEQELIVSPGDQRNERVEFPRSRVRLRVMRRNRNAGRARVTLTRTVLGSQEVVVQAGGDEHIPISPGRYNGVVRIGNQEITVEGITFMGGATQDVPININ